MSISTKMDSGFRVCNWCLGIHRMSDCPHFRKAVNVINGQFEHIKRYLELLEKEKNETKA